MDNPNILDVASRYLQTLKLRLDDKETRERFLSAVPEEHFDSRARLTLDTQINHGHWLLFHLGNQGARFSDFIYWLQLANLENVLLDLDVDVPLQIIKQPPSRVRIQEGALLTVSCEAYSFPRPEFQWFKEETELLSQQDSSLVIPSIKLQDSGLYFCIVSKRSTQGHIKTLRANVVEVIVSPATSLFPSPSKRKSNASPLEQIPEVLSEQGPKEWNHATPDGKTKLENPNAVPRYFAESKIALFIANDSYEAYKPLKTPETDVSDLAQLLKKMHFKVFAFKNLNKKDMDKVLSVFYSKIKENSYAIFFFAGHGFEHDGQTYLQPVDCSESYKQNECVCTEKIVQNLQTRKPALNVLLIDACRKPAPDWSGPWKKYKTHMEGNTIYGYSTSFLSNSYECEEQNSFFVKHLKKYIEEDKSVQEVLMHVLGAFKEENLGAYQNPVIKTSLSDFRKLRDPLRNPSTSRIHSSPNNYHQTLTQCLDPWGLKPFNFLNNSIRTEVIECPKYKCKFIIENKNMDIFFNGVCVDVYMELEETADLSTFDFIEINLEFDLPSRQVTPRTSCSNQGVLLKDLSLRFGFKNLLFTKEVIGIQHLRNEEMDVKLIMITHLPKISRIVSKYHFPINIGNSWTDFELNAIEDVISESY